MQRKEGRVEGRTTRKNRRGKEGKGRKEGRT